MCAKIETKIPPKILETPVEPTTPLKLAHLAQKIEHPLPMLKGIASKLEEGKSLHSIDSQENTVALLIPSLPLADIPFLEHWELCEGFLKKSEEALSQADENEEQILDEAVQMLYKLIPLNNIEDVQAWCFLLFEGLSQLLFFRKKHDTLSSLAKTMQEICLARGETATATCFSAFLFIIHHSPYCSPAQIDTLLAQLSEQEQSNEEIDKLLYMLLGHLHFLRGEYGLLLHYYEKYSENPLQELPLLHELFSMNLSVGSLFLDRLHISFGIIESYRHTAELTGKKWHAMLWRTHLVFFLLRKRSYDDALLHINQITDISKEIRGPLVSSVVRRAHAAYHYSNGQFDAAQNLLRLDAKEAVINNQHIIPFTDPLVLKMIAKLEFEGLIAPGYELEKVLQRVEACACRLLRGVALRIHALQLSADKTQKIALLKESFTELQKTGNTDELLHTASELAQCLDAQGNNRESRMVRNKIALFTVEQRKKDTLMHGGRNEAFPVCNAYLASLFVNRPEQGEVALQRLVGLIQRELGAQRAALFRINESNSLECVCSVNLNPVELEAVDFQPLRERLEIRLLHAEKQPDFFHDKETDCGFFLTVEPQTSWLLYLNNKLASGIFNKISQREGIAVAFVLSAELRNILHKGKKHTEEHSTVNTDLPAYYGVDMERVLQRATHAAHSSAAILITGETGTGKEQIAHYIHKTSSQTGEFVPIQLSCIPEHLFESELFGHELGSFTGAIRQRRGLIELAHQGTLFLDEIADIPLRIQIKLLRVLQEKKFTRVGGNQVIFSDFRLISATNKDLSEEIQKGRFREDLLYRLSVIPLELPPLRSRKRDLPELAIRLLKHYGIRCNKAIPPLDDEKIKILLQYKWPGNIRELCSIMEQYVIFGELSLKGTLEPYTKEDNDTFFTDTPSMEALQERYLRFILDKTKGKIYGHDGAAAILGMTKSTLYKKIEKYGLRNTENS